MSYLPYSSIFIIYTVFVMTFFLHSIDANVDPKNRYDDYDVNRNYDYDQDYDALRANVKQFDLAEPEGTKKLLAELRRAHYKNLKLQSYISDLLDIWLFRNAAFEPNRTMPKMPTSPSAIHSIKSNCSKDSHRKDPKVSQPLREHAKLDKFAPKSSSIKQSTTETKYSTGGATTPSSVQQKTNNISVAEVLRMVTTIKHQASVVLKNACALELQILLANDKGQLTNLDVNQQILSKLSPIIAKEGSPPVVPASQSNTKYPQDSAKRLPMSYKKPYPISWSDPLIDQ